MIQLNLTWMSSENAMKPFWALLGVLSLLSGCIGTSKVDVLEARLREQEVVVQNYQSQVVSVQSQLTVAQRESKILRVQFAKAGKKIPAVEATAAIASVETLKFSSLLTAGQDKDSQPGDERFHAIVIPYDSAGELVKVVGDVEFEAIDLSLPEDQRTVGHWEYTPEKAKQLWHSGFLATGYRFDLPWEQLPQGKEILLHMRLKTPDGRELTASHTMKIAPPAKLAVAPELLKVAEDVQQVKAEEPAAAEKSKAQAEKTKIARPKPLLDVTTTADEAPGRAKILPVSFEKKSNSPNEGLNLENPRPFPGGIRTSDNWTEATIPVLR